MSTDRPMAPEPLSELIAGAESAPIAVVGFGIPRCPASELLAASLPAVGAARPGLRVGYALLGRTDWELREDLLWPRGIRVTRSSVPSISLFREGVVVASRIGGGPASAIDGWLSDTLGPADEPVDDGLTAAEEAALRVDPERRAQHLTVRDRDRAGPPTS